MNRTEELRNLIKLRIYMGRSDGDMVYICSEEEIAYLLEKSKEILNRRSCGNGNHQNRS